MGGWRKLHNEELHDLYSWSAQVKEDEMGGHVTRMWEKRNAYRLLVGKPEGKRLLVRPRCSWWIILGWILDT
jgi:hypothetical protein